MAAVDENCQLHAHRTTHLAESIKGRANGATREEDIIDEHDSPSFNP
jgi:hypothetical protein